MTFLTFPVVDIVADIGYRADVSKHVAVPGIAAIIADDAVQPAISKNPNRSGIGRNITKKYDHQQGEMFLLIIAINIDTAKAIVRLDELFMLNVDILERRRECLASAFGGIFENRSP